MPVIHRVFYHVILPQLFLLSSTKFALCTCSKLCPEMEAVRNSGTYAAAFIALEYKN